MFSTPLPSFNIKGQTEVKTNLGTIMSILLTIAVLFYAAIKFIQLHSKSNPVISSFQEAFQTDEQNPINLNAMGFRAAFAFEGFVDNELKDDPRFVKNIARYIVKKDFVWTRTNLPFHKCSDEELAQFSPINPLQEDTLQKRMQGTGFFCLDWDDSNPFLVYGH